MNVIAEEMYKPDHINEVLLCFGIRLYTGKGQGKELKAVNLTRGGDNSLCGDGRLVDLQKCRHIHLRCISCTVAQLQWNLDYTTFRRLHKNIV